MNTKNENSDELTDADKGISAEQREKKQRLKPKAKKIVVTGAMLALLGASIYGLVQSDSGDEVATTSSASETAQGDPQNSEEVEVAPDLDSDQDGALDSSLTVKPVLSLLGKPAHDDKVTTPVEMADTPPAEPQKIKPLIADDPEQLDQSPARKAEWLAPSERINKEVGDDPTAALSSSDQPAQAEAAALQEATAAAFTGAAASANVLDQRHDEPKELPRSSSPDVNNVYAPASTSPGMQNGNHGALYGASQYRAETTEKALGKVAKHKHSNEGLYFVKVAKSLPTKIRLLPEQTTEKTAFLSNEQEWEVKRFNQDVVIVGLRAGASSTAVTDLLIKQGEKYYSFTLAATMNPADRDNTVIFTK